MSCSKITFRAAVIDHLKVTFGSVCSAGKYLRALPSVIGFGPDVIDGLIQILANVEWTIDQIIPWNDGTGHVLTAEKRGKFDGSIALSSPVNDWFDRETSLSIYGEIPETVTVSQEGLREELMFIDGPLRFDDGKIGFLKN